MAYKKPAYIERMWKYYGKNPYKRKCSECCNCQTGENGEKVCIAYSDTVPWQPEKVGCEKLFNSPFLAQEPALRKLSGLYSQNNLNYNELDKNDNKKGGEQMCLI